MPSNRLGRTLAFGAVLLMAACKTEISENLAGSIEPRVALNQISMAGSIREATRSNSRDLFQDRRARKIGDILTVAVSINDKASIGNSSERLSESSVKTAYQFAIDLFGLRRSGDLSADVDSNSTHKGQGNIDRSEKIQFSVAATIQEVDSAGNFKISSQQTIRINNETRVVGLHGLVRPQDISRDNIVSYEKVANAELTYGGRGILSEVQKPQYGQRIYDQLKPF